ncbi:MAG: hydroxymethylglutaryl-CoA lyase [Parahaliea sp.]
MSLPSKVTLVEVGPRDGLQNEKASLRLADKIRLVEDLADAGHSIIEVGSFVNPGWVPQMADSKALFKAIRRKPGTRYAALTPNMQGFEQALTAEVDEVAVFAAASESFSRKNINCSIADSLARFRPLLEAAHSASIPVRGYVSCVLGCPYEGDIAPEQVLNVSTALLAMGCCEVSLGDTIGTGTAGSMARLLEQLLQTIPADQLAVHCHDTYGQALANILVALQHGITTIDTAIAGLGGCPYAKGASGNVATEDVVYMLNGLGIDSGLSLNGLIRASARISGILQRQPASRVARALLAQTQSN